MIILKDFDWLRADQTFQRSMNYGWSLVRIMMEAFNWLRLAALNTKLG